jgi:TolB-like protein/DNA-binding winged helix-turn-helix (wHTH) protein/Tfp pilus assembly protein PilF
VESGPLPLERPIRFGADCELDPNSYELRRSGRVLKLERIPTEILLFLVERRGQLVTRDEIAERVWGKDVFLDTDNSINGAIRKIRQVLKDDPERPRFIQTISGRGYRFIAPAPEEAQPAATPDPDTASLAPTQAVSVPALAADDGKLLPPRAMKSRKAHWLVVAAIAGVVLGGAATAAWIFRPWSSPRVHPAGGRVILAVLPFQNLTGDPSQDYFSDGMTEEMIAQLGNLDPQHLGVIARTSVMHYKNGKTPLDQIGRELGVQYVLEGSVRRDADKVRITAQLIQMKDQSHLWSRRYDRELKSTLALQSEIAQQIAGEIQLALGRDTFALVAEPPRQSFTSYEAYDLYLRGRYFWNKRTAAGFQQAIDYFQQAIAKDPGYARAYAGLADCYVLLAAFSGVPPAEPVQKARAAATKALQLDEGLAEAHTSLALITENYDWDWPAAEKEYRRAIELNPNYATAYQWYAEYLTWLGRFDEASRASERARELDPLSLIIAADDGMIFYYSRQYGRAETKLNAVLEMDPTFNRAHQVREVYVEEGRFAEALGDIEKCRTLFGMSVYWSSLAYTLGRSGHAAEAKHALDELERSNRQQPVNPAAMAWAYAGMGDKEQTLQWLNKAYAQRSNTMTALKVEPAYDFLRSDPRFQDLIHRVGLD